MRPWKDQGLRTQSAPLPCDARDPARPSPRPFGSENIFLQPVPCAQTEPTSHPNSTMSGFAVAMVSKCCAKVTEFLLSTPHQEPLGLKAL